MTGTVRTVRCDALVIGSGAGGSTAALELAGAGREVHVLEEGPLVPQTRITRASPAENLRLLYRQGGLVPIHGAPTIPFGEGRCVGGTTVVNGGLLWRPPEHLLECWASAGVDGFRAHHHGPPRPRWGTRPRGGAPHPRAGAPPRRVGAPPAP
ncbi:GMC family oxidoreductase N-terminal domain-containing protein, partial [Kitasatospora sp. NPDC059088]|uniref:GMC family oxidoreductase N-terminal domain-containing protein n=1 Tax=Kitasatospora sp. NPDC059088 TaxID=3346722 RepID=UPI0036925771